MPALSGKSADRIADWIEVQALRRRTPVTSETLHELAASEGFTSTDISLAMNSVRRRAFSLGEAYPFRSASGSIAALPSAGESGWTKILLASQESPARNDAALWAPAPEHFERLVAAASSRLFGSVTEVVRFGWPSEDARPVDFPGAIKWLADSMGVQLGRAYRDPFRKDGGVDVVAWRPFHDQRSGFPVLLVQSTVERDFSHKANDIDIRVWAGWLALEQDPMTALAVPEVVPTGELWNSITSRSMLLDRPRLAQLLHEPGPDVGRYLAPVNDWVSMCLARMQPDS